MHHHYRHTIPPLMSAVLKRILPRRDSVYLLGDISEIYTTIAREHNQIYARIWFYFQILKSLPGFFSGSIYWSGMMIHNYLKVALRNMLSHKLFSFINIFGLALGMASAILIFLYVQDELSYDRYHQNADRIYRLDTILSDPGFGQNGFATASAPWAPALVDEIPELENYVRFEQVGRAFNALSGKTLTFHVLLKGGVLAVIMLFSIMVGLLSGTYPALLLSSFVPTRVLRGNPTRQGSKASLRKLLVVVQFSVSIAMIICTGIVYRQLKYFNAKSLGFDKEQIGIRKVLGASLPNLLLILSKEYVLLIGMANVIAWPVTGFIMQKWLQNFHYREPISFVLFVLSGVLALGIALITVSFQAFRAANSDPVRTLKVE